MIVNNDSCFLIIFVLLLPLAPSVSSGLFIGIKHYDGVQEKREQQTAMQAGDLVLQPTWNVFHSERIFSLGRKALVSLLSVRSVCAWRGRNARGSSAISKVNYRQHSCIDNRSLPPPPPRPLGICSSCLDY